MGDLFFIATLVVILGGGGYVCFFLYREVKHSNEEIALMKEDLDYALEIMKRGEEALEELEEEEDNSDQKEKQSED